MIETWVDLLAVVDRQLDEQLTECELSQERMEATASAASTVEHTESADRRACCDEFVDETVQPRATVTGLNETECTELSTDTDDSDSTSEGIATEFDNLVQTFENGGPMKLCKTICQYGMKITVYK